MKKINIILSLIFSMMLWANQIFAQATPPSDHGGGAPIGGGLFILLGLGAVYGGKKWYNHRKETLEE